MKPRVIQYFLTILVAFLISACSTSEDQQLETRFELPEEIVEEDSVLMHCMAIQQRVIDYKKWQKGFNEHDSLRDAYGLSVLNVFRFAEDTNKIMVLLEIEDLEKAFEYAALSEVWYGMKDLGVIGQPVVNVLNAIHIEKKQKDSHCILIQHDVADHKKWKEHFLDYNRNNKNENISALCLFYFNDNPQKVSVLLEVSDFEIGKQLVSSESAKKDMREMGAITEPVLTLLTVVE